MLNDLKIMPDFLVCFTIRLDWFLLSNLLKPITNINIILFLILMIVMIILKY